MQCKEWDDANSELFKESHDEAVHKNSYKSRLYDLISASLECCLAIGQPTKRKASLYFSLPLEGKQDVTGLPSCFLSTLNILLN